MRVIALEEHYCFESPLEAAALANVPAAMVGARDRLREIGPGRIADMDAAGIDVQVLSLVPPAAQELPPADAVAVARAENDRLADAVATRPDRFGAFATLPTPDPEAAAVELERSVSTLGFCGAMIHGHSGGRFLDEKQFWPIFESAEALDVPVYLHPTYPPQGVVDLYYRDMPKPLSTAGWGWHVDTGLHTLRLIVGGVFDRFPRLQVILGHMGEMIPFALARVDERMTPVCTHLERGVADYFCDNFYVTTSGFFTDPPLQCTLSVLGADRIMFSVDYPFSENVDARSWFDQAPLSPADRGKIAHANAERLLKLDPVRASSA